MLQKTVDHTISVAPEIDWSICIRDNLGRELASRNPDVSMKTASVGKLLLLAEVARQCNEGGLDDAELLTRDYLVADSGTWQRGVTPT